MERQCGFEKSLPRVCCERDEETTEQPRLAEVEGETIRLNMNDMRSISVEIPSECGLANGGSNRIVNGQPANLNGWPWIAALGYQNLSTGEIVYRCGAALVTARHLVTAAHCVRGDLATVLLGVRFY